MKRLLSIILSAVMLLSLVPMSMFSVSAERSTDSQGVEHTLSGGRGYYIVSYLYGSVTEVVIPAKYNGLPVKEIGKSAFNWCYRLTSIEIPNSVTFIGYEAFYGCDRLTDIYCEAESQPEGWYEGWNRTVWDYETNDSIYATVHWGCEMTNKAPALGNIDDLDEGGKPTQKPIPEEAFIDIAIDHGLASPDTADKTYRKALDNRENKLKNFNLQVEEKNRKTEKQKFLILVSVYLNCIVTVLENFNKLYNNNNVDP